MEVNNGKESDIFEKIEKQSNTKMMKSRDKSSLKPKHFNVDFPSNVKLKKDILNILFKNVIKI